MAVFHTHAVIVMEDREIYMMLLQRIQVYHGSVYSSALFQDEEIQVNLVCVDIVYFIFEIQKFLGGGM